MDEKKEKRYNNGLLFLILSRHCICPLTTVFGLSRGEGRNTFWSWLSTARRLEEWPEFSFVVRLATNRSLPSSIGPDRSKPDGREKGEDDDGSTCKVLHSAQVLNSSQLEYGCIAFARFCVLFNRLSTTRGLSRHVAKADVDFWCREFETIIRYRGIDEMPSYLYYARFAGSFLQQAINPRKKTLPKNIMCQMLQDPCAGLEALARFIFTQSGRRR